MPTTQIESDSTTSTQKTPCRHFLDLPIDIRYLIYQEVLHGLLISNASCPNHSQDRLPRFPRYESCRANCRAGLCFVEVSNKGEDYTHRPRPFDCLQLVNHQIHDESQSFCRIPTTLEVVSWSSLKAFSQHHPTFKPKKLRRACALTVEIISVTAIKWDYEGLATTLAPALSYLPQLRVLEVRLPWYGVCDPPNAEDRQEMEGIHTEWSLAMYGWEKFSEFGPVARQRYGSQWETIVRFERQVGISELRMRLG